MKKRLLQKLIAPLMVIGFVFASSNALAGGCTAPAGVSGVSTTGITDAAVTFNWATGASNATNTYIQLYSNAALTTSVGTSLPAHGNGSQVITGFACATTYYYRIRNYNSSSGGCFQSGGGVTGSFTTAACPTCSDGIQNGTETGVDCGGTCPACSGPGSTDPAECEPCSGGAHTISNADAIDPTSTGECVNTDIDNSCSFSSSGVYGSACGPKSSGSHYTTQYRTWYKVQVPATGIVGMDVQPLVGSERHYVKTMLFTNLTCSGATASASFSSPDNCSWVNESNCGGGDVCGPNGTLTLYTDLIGTADGLGSQSYWSGLTPGSYVWVCVDLLGVVSGASSPYTATIETCFWDSFAGDVNNFIGGAATPCGGTVTGTTRSSLQGLSLCAGFKPPNCGGGPAPSYENVSVYQMTADAAGTDITIDLTGASCEGSTAGLQFLIYSAGDISGCVGTTPLCGSGTCTLGSCLGGNTASGLGDKSYTIVAPTPNQTFFVMIDGFAGSICSFNITSTGCIPVPITLIDFQAIAQGNEAFLHWQTASELNNDFYELERSLDGVDFRSIHRIDGKGTTSEESYYEFVDKPNFNGTVYYRLKQVDFDGNASYSFTRAVTFGKALKGVEVTPNPVVDKAEVKIGGLVANEEFAVELTDLNGRVVWNKEIKNNTLGQRVVDIDMSSVKSGVYFVTVRKESGVVQSKIIKN